MNWENVKEITDEQNTYTIPDNWLLIHYYEALNILFRIENALRIFVYSILKNEYFEKWAETAISSDDGGETTIQALAKRRISQTQDFGYIGYYITCPIMHLTSGELSKIITHKSYWKLFEPYFKAKKEIISYKLDEIGNVRNALAHFRAIKLGDVDVVKSNSLHIFLSIKDYITSLISMGTIIPTNCDAVWYQKLKTLKFDNGTISYYQSDDKKWVKIWLRFKIPVIETKDVPERWVKFKLLNLIPANILKFFPSITQFTTYLSEGGFTSTISDISTSNLHKGIYFTMREDCLSINYEKIYDSFLKLFEKISTEITMIQQDHYAQGDLIRSCTSYFWWDKDKDKWKRRNDPVTCEVQENDPIEYWGSFFDTYGEFIVSTNKYPWIPVEVSKESIPF